MGGADTTRRFIGDAFALADMGPKPLASFKGARPIYRVEGERSGGDACAPRSGDALAPPVGRRMERGRLVRLWGEARRALFIEELTRTVLEGSAGRDGETRDGVMLASS